jgi:flagellar basal-body rod protein FlgC
LIDGIKWKDYIKDRRRLDMLSAISSALSGLLAFAKKTNVISNNLANTLTDDFKKSRVTMKEGSKGGVEAVVEKVNSPGYPIPEIIRQDSNVSAKETSNIDIAEEMTNLILTSKGYKANLKTIKAADENLGALLDIKA